MCAPALADVPNDGLRFDEVAVTGLIALDGNYPGVRAKLRGELEGARFVLQLDIGVGDATVPPPTWVEYPTLLGGPSPRILAYHPATAVAEKFEAIVNLGLVNSRMKDFYDLWMVATTLSFSGKDLQSSIVATFANRRTVLPAEVPVALTGEYTGQDRVVSMWNAYARKLNTSGIAAPTSLLVAADMIRTFVMPPTLAASAGEEFSRVWSPAHGWR